MRRRVAFVVLLLPLAAVGACLSFGDLQGGGEDADIDATTLDGALNDVAIVDTSTIDANIIVDTGPVDVGDGGILACNAPGLVAYWPMNEGAGDTITDCFQGIQGRFSSYGEGGVTWGTRDDGGASLEFLGNGVVLLGVRPQFQLPGAFTVAGWVRSDRNPSNYVSMFYNYASTMLTGVELALTPTNGAYAQMGFGTTNAKAEYPASPVLGKWAHLAAVYTPGVGLEVYLNGTSVGATTTTEDGGPIPDSGFASNTGRQALIGADTSISYWGGGIDEVRLFSRALSDTEIKALAAQ